ncbi:DNA helicase RecQ [Ameyamaea chiangmaiensis]|nr:DNA helicase RecQ [Ameyamaea chiangmaiensis]
MDRAHAVLRETFGFSAFRGLQEAAVARVMDGQDTLVLMPTGGGKSVCYQVPGLARTGLALVISPLIALMQDQVAALRQLGVNAAALHSELDPDDASQVWTEINAGRLKFLYVSPERLLSPGMIDRLARQELALIAIDEAHCVSAWGHDFRPEYRALASLPAHFPGVPRIALTATADERTREDILGALGMPDAERLVASFHRPNLHVAATPKASELRQLTSMLDAHRTGASIVYCGSRAKTERVAATLAGQGWPAIAFHAGLSPMEKRAALMRFRSGERIVVVATIAFGMGIDRPDVRCVVHLDMPASPEGYYQQIGRAGRDGEPAHTLLLYGGEDMARARHWLDQSQAPESERRVMSARLEAMIALTETTGCRTQALLACFGEVLPAACGHCDNCAHPVASFDGTDAARKVLSAIYRTGQRFGAVHVASVLRGKSTDMTRRHQHEGLSVFGIGKDRSEQFWRGVIRQLIARGAVMTVGDYNGLALDERVARPILRGEVPVLLREDTEGALKRAALPDRAPRYGDDEDHGLDAEGERVFTALRDWRRTEAREQEIPPYVIFHDAVLRDIARERPDDLDLLGRIKGVGASKLARYGDAVLEAIAEAT